MSKPTVDETLDALKDMVEMYDYMMKKINHGSSCYDAKCISMMNNAPIKARKVLTESGRLP